MATYIVSFRIASGSDYQKRYDSVVEAIRNEADGATTWEETTSVVILKSDKTPETLASTIYFGSSFSATIDTMLVVNTCNNTFAKLGEIKYPNTLESLFNINALALIDLLRT